MTSLAKQLQRLAVAHTQSILGDDTRRASLLFDPKEAANIDRDTFYAIGVNGLQELTTINAKFEEFEATLFSLSSQSFERSVQSKEANTKIDVLLERFLLLVSPYLLLKPAQKCIEWLINRYHIHFYNEDAIMLCILPYHESNVFVRMLQLLQLNSPSSKYHWLLPLQKSGNHLTRSVLINHCHKNPGFLNFICNMVHKYIQAHSPTGSSCVQLRACFALYTSVIAGFLQREKVSEESVAVLKPFLGRGLESPLSDYKCATYMIIAQLCRRVHMSRDLCEQLLSLMIKRYSLQHVQDCLCCVLLIFQTQSITSLPKKAFKYLLRIPSLSSTLIDLLHSYQSKVFLAALLTRLLPLTARRCSRWSASSSEASDGEQTTRPDYVGLLKDLLCLGLLDAQSSLLYIRMFLENCLLYTKMADTTDLYTNIRPLISTFESRYTESLSKVIEEMKAGARDKGEKRSLNDLLTASLSGARFKVMPSNDTSLLLSLQHNLVYMRVQAVQHIYHNLPHYLDADREFVEESLLQRLTDDKSAVVMAVLKQDELLWKCVTEEGQLVDRLKEVLVRAECNQWVQVSLAAVRVLGHSHDPSLMTYLLPYIVASQDVAMVILSSPLAEWSVVTNAYKSGWLSLLRDTQDGCQSPDFYDQFTRDIAEFYSTHDAHYIVSEVRGMRDSSCTHVAPYKHQYQALIAAVINQLIQTAVGDQVEFQTGVVPIQTGLIDTMLRAKETRMEALVFAEILVRHLEIPQSIQELTWWFRGDGSTADHFTESLAGLFAWSLNNSAAKLHNSDHFKKFINIFIENFSLAPRSFISFLAVMTTGHLRHTAHFVDPTLQARSLAVMAATVAKLSVADVTELLSRQAPLVTSVLVALTSKIADVRALSLKIVHLLANKCPSSVHAALFTQLDSMAEEIRADAGFITQVMAGVSRGDNPAVKRRRASLTPSPCLSHILATVTDADTPPPVSASLLSMLDLINTPETQAQLVPHLDRLIRPGAPALNCVELEVTVSLLSRFTPHTATSLAAQSCQLDTFVEACRYHTGASDRPPEVSHAAIQQVTKDFYANVPDEGRCVLLTTLLDILVESERLDTVNLVKRVLKHISLSGEHLVPELMRVCDATVATVKDSKLRKRMSRQPCESDPTELDTPLWRRVVLTLEVIQNKKKVGDAHKVIAPCFNILAKVLEVEKEGTGEYLKQLLLSTLYSITGRLAETPHGMEMLKGENLHMEMIVQCVRANNNPQTVHQALLLLSVVANIDPTALLNHVITVFTFMGASVLRQDDAYSMHVIGRILESLIPQVIRACDEQLALSRTSGPSASNTVLMVAQVFVAAYQHMPQHRRLVLFTKLVTVLGESEYLWVILLLMMEQHVCREAGVEQETVDESGSEESLDVEFCLQLCAQFPVQDQIHTATRVIGHLASLPTCKDDIAASKNLKLRRKGDEEKSEIFDVKLRSDKQLRHFRFKSITLLISLFGGNALVAQVAESEAELLGEWRGLVEAVLQYVCGVSGVCDSQAGRPTAKYWRIVQHRLCDVLDKVMSLLPADLFYAIISSLIDHNLTAVQRKAMELLNTNVQGISRDSLPPQKQIDQLVAISDQLHTYVSTSLTAVQSDDHVSTIQTALFCLKLLCRLLGQHQPQSFIKVVKLGSELFTRVGVAPPISACALLCLAESCSSLKVHVIPHLSLFIPPLVLLMQDPSLVRNELLLMSVVTTLHKLVDNLSHFISPYLQDIITFVCMLTVSDLSHVPRPQLTTRLQAIKHSLATRVPARVMLPALDACHKHVSTKHYRCVQPLMHLLSDLITRMTPDDLSSLHQRTLAFFLVCLDFRSKHPAIEAESLSDVESDIIESVCVLVLRLSEETFRPMLFKLFHWATENVTAADRVLVFYRLADRLAERLKSLFTLFAGHIIKHTATVLDENNVSKNENLKEDTNRGLLLAYTLDCMAKCFMYNTEPFLNKERFDHLMQPLVDQIDNNMDGDAAYMSRVTDHLVPSISQFAAAVRDDSLWTSLNYQILLKSRSHLPKVRYASLMVLEGVHKRLGEDSISLLTDTVPFLAELMEDENEEVEEKCQGVMGEMEKIHGESLQKYF